MRTGTEHFRCEIEDGIATLRLDRPDRKNPLTLDSYSALRDWIRDLPYDDGVKAVVFGSNGGNFCSGGDVHDIIGPLTKMSMKELLAFTRMTCDLVKAMMGYGTPITAAADGVCVGAGAIIAMASDLRIATPSPKPPSCSHASGLPAATWGLRNAAAHHRPGPCGRTAVYRPLDKRRRRRPMRGGGKRIVPAADLDDAARDMAVCIAAGPSFAHMMTKTMLNQERSMSRDRAIKAQAICMHTADFIRAFDAFVVEEKPVFEGADARPLLPRLAVPRGPPPRSRPRVGRLGRGAVRDRPHRDRRRLP